MKTFSLEVSEILKDKQKHMFHVIGLVFSHLENSIKPTQLNHEKREFL